MSENNQNKPETLLNEQKIEKPDDDGKKFMWEQFCRLGERIGDGDMDADEEKWVNREYKRLSRILVPEIDEHYKEVRKAKAIRVNEQIKKLIEIKKCDCGGSLRQSRAGSKICYCKLCNKRFKAVSKKN